MKEKKFLYIGLLFLYSAILVKIFTNSRLSLYLLLVAVCFKLLFALKRIKKGEYKPGFELILLVVGLFLFLWGLYAPLPYFILSKSWLMLPGLVLKFSFLIIFIVKVKRAKKFSN